MSKELIIDNDSYSVWWRITVVIEYSDGSTTTRSREINDLTHELTREEAIKYANGWVKQLKERGKYVCTYYLDRFIGERYYEEA